MLTPPNLRHKKLYIVKFTTQQYLKVNNMLKCYITTQSCTLQVDTAPLLLSSSYSLHNLMIYICTTLYFTQLYDLYNFVLHASLCMLKLYDLTTLCFTQFCAAPTPAALGQLAGVTYGARTAGWQRWL